MVQLRPTGGQTLSRISQTVRDWARASNFLTLATDDSSFIRAALVRVRGKIPDSNYRNKSEALFGPRFYAWITHSLNAQIGDRTNGS